MNPTAGEASPFNERVAARKTMGTVAGMVFLLATLLSLLVLVVLIVDVLVSGLATIDRQFLNGFPSRFPGRAGIKAALLGSIYMILITAVIAVPVGVASALYLEEYAGKGRIYKFVQINIANLAGVPSVIYGILGLAFFVRLANLGQSLLAASLTMALLILPVIIISTQEALRAVPQGVRESAFALGATRSQVIASHLLPMAAPGIFTGVILSLSRAIGEAAPILIVGAATVITFLPASVMDSFTALPIQIFDWTGRPQPAFHELAAGAIIILLVILFAMNLVAILLRNRFDRYRAV